jgi:hypothetical protein
MSTAPYARPGTQLAFAAINAPRRVRLLLEGVLDIVAPEFERVLALSLDEFEQQLFNFAERGGSSAEEARWIGTQQTVKRHRHELMPRLRTLLVAELGRLREAAAATDNGAIANDPGIGVATQFSLATTLEVDESSVVAQMSNRVEMRNNLSLFLLGQRFGVLAAKPGLGSEAIPIGPQAFGRMLRQASDCLQLSPEDRRLFFKTTEKHLMVAYGELIDVTNNYLVKNGILPDFGYMPTRARKATQIDSAAKPTPAPRAPVESNSLGFDPTWQDVGGRRVTAAVVRFPEPDTAPPSLPAPRSRSERAPAGPAQPSPADGMAKRRSDIQPPVLAPEAQGEMSFEVMRQLLAKRNQLLEKLKHGSARMPQRSTPVSKQDLQDALRALQDWQPAPLGKGDNRVTRTIQDIKHDLMSSLQATSGGQQSAVIGEEESDAIELVSMLFDSINRETKLNSLAAHLLEKLQVPLLRVALEEKEFFQQHHHPAKDLLDAIAESGAYWLGDDEPDVELLDKMNSVVDRTVREFDGDVSLFDQLSHDINSHLHLLTHKAEVAERRHVEAARGKEKLTYARAQASDAIAAMLAGSALPSFTQALLREIWTDVLALTHLRHGEGTSEWQHQLDLAAALVKAAADPAGKSSLTHVQALELRKDLEASLTRVGYQADEIDAIAQKLINPQPDRPGDSESSTELAKRLKSRAHFGVDPKAASEAEIPLSDEAKRRYEQLKLVAFGTWFEFVTNQQGDRVRQRLAWFSTTTGHSLFVNKRGQKVGEYHLKTLARRMVAGEVMIAEEKSGGIIDRAWRSVMSALRTFAGQPSAGSAA